MQAGGKESKKVPGRKLASSVTETDVQTAEEYVWAGHHEIQRAPADWGQGLQNSNVSGAGVSQSNPEFCRRELAS